MSAPVAPASGPERQRDPERTRTEILERGRAQGLFRHDTDAIDVHMMISAYCVFRVANRYTFGAIFGRDLLDPDRREYYRTLLGDMIVNYLTAAGGSTALPSGSGRRRLAQVMP
jgi:hypothetical protein